jgi:outer membrane immunogenic protein
MTLSLLVRVFPTTAALAALLALPAPADAAGKKKMQPAAESPAVPPSPIDMPIPVAFGAYNWAGYYAGGFVGGAHGMWTVDFFRNDNHGHAEEGLDGGEIGGFAGYNMVWGPSTIVGLEADLGITNASQSNNIFDNDTSYATYNGFGSIRGRLGYTIDRMLIYGTAGLAFANISNEIQKGRNPGEQVVWDDQTRTGYALGAGAEYAVSDRWRARAEYLYSNFGTVTLFNADGNRAEFENALHQVRLGLSYRF